MMQSSRDVSFKMPVALACALGLTGALLLPGCGAAGSQAQDAASNEAVEEEAPKPLTAEEIDSWFAGEEGFAGRPVTVIGQVNNVRRENGLTQLYICTDFESGADKAVVFCEGPNPKIPLKSYVKVEGVAGDIFGYQNDYGADMSAPSIEADSVEEVSYKDAVAPTTTSLSPAAENEQNGYKVTVDTIEFSEKETRIYLTVTNNGAGRFTLHAGSAVVVQDGVQFNTETNTDADYPTISDSIVPGASMSGVITFPPLETAGFELWMRGMADGTQDGIGSFDFNFKFNVK
ncbi:MAG: hypothetical protein Q3963_07415 [Coriobacteriaceae bacterium]|nr:hypothetical protein [Coriobacteriaceae bacterium]